MGFGDSDLNFLMKSLKKNKKKQTPGHSRVTPGLLPGNSWARAYFLINILTRWGHGAPDTPGCARRGSGEAVGGSDGFGRRKNGFGGCWKAWKGLVWGVRGVGALGESCDRVRRE